MASLATTAAMSFEPWRRDDPAADAVVNCLRAEPVKEQATNARIALAFMYQSKEELIASLNSMEGHVATDVVLRLLEAADYYKGIHELIRGANARLTVAAAAMASPKTRVRKKKGRSHA